MDVIILSMMMRLMSKYLHILMITEYVSCCHHVMYLIHYSIENVFIEDDMLLTSQ